MKRISMLLCAVAILLLGCGNGTNNGKEGDNGGAKEEKKGTVTNEKPETGTMKDYDGNTYKTVKIGKQEWMAENMRATHDRDGKAIVCGGVRAFDRCRYYPDGDSSNVADYGYLYNWEAAVKVCPRGWHLSTDAEWKQLLMDLGMSKKDANKKEDFVGNIAAKMCCEVGWPSTDKGAGNVNAPDRNSSGFSALPAGEYNASGYCQDGGIFPVGHYEDFGRGAFFWTSTFDEEDDFLVYIRGFVYNESGVGLGCCPTHEQLCYSVRCVRD